MRAAGPRKAFIDTEGSHETEKFLVNLFVSPGLLGPDHCNSRRLCTWWRIEQCSDGGYWISNCIASIYAAHHRSISIATPIGRPVSVGAGLARPLGSTFGRPLSIGSLHICSRSYRGGPIRAGAL